MRRVQHLYVCSGEWECEGRSVWMSVREDGECEECSIRTSARENGNAKSAAFVRMAGGGESVHTIQPMR